MWEGLFLLRRVKIRMGSLLVLLIVPFVSAAFNLDTDSAVVYQVSQAFDVAAKRDESEQIRCQHIMTLTNTCDNFD